jgi:hypothetical protein
MLRALALILLFLQPPTSSELVGRWDAEGRSRGGLGSWLELARDGSCAQSIGAMVDGTWTLEGQTLTLTVTDEKGVAQGQSARVDVAGNVQTQTGSGQSRKMTRMGSATSATMPHVGVWRYFHYTGEQAFDEYTVDGRFLFRMPMGTEACRWKATPTALRLTFPQRVQETEWQIAGDRLTLADGRSSQSLRRETANAIPPLRPR